MLARISRCGHDGMESAHGCAMGAPAVAKLTPAHATREMPQERDDPRGDPMERGDAVEGRPERFVRPQVVRGRAVDFPFRLVSPKEVSVCRRWMEGTLSGPAMQPEDQTRQRRLQKWRPAMGRARTAREASVPCRQRNIS